MARPLWKGAISFGLVTIPVNVYSATRRDELRFRQLDRRDNSPIREKRVNEETGEEVPWEDVVRGFEYDEGSYVVLDQDDFTQANVKATETIDIVQAVPHDAVPPEYFEKPLYVVPTKTGIKPYHILRETLRRTGRVAVATIVMRGRQHLAALIAGEEVITLELLRFAHEIKAVSELDVGEALEAPEVKDKEVQLAEQLVAALDEPWDPEQFHDDYREDLLALIETKAKTGRTPAKKRRTGAPGRRRSRRHDGTAQEERRRGQGPQGPTPPQGELMAGLRTYRRKRDFTKTAEPEGAAEERPAAAREARLSGGLFCIQKHAARRLHHDLRLELDGVLISWAVPKGPSLDPKVRRLAVHVEDHPIEYGDFEGTIPKGEYGGGTVMLWDSGSWEPIGGDARAGLEKGELKFRLAGERLGGGWVLVHTRGSGDDEENQWLLIKERDDEARPGEPDPWGPDDRSVATGRTMDEIAAGSKPRRRATPAADRGRKNGTGRAASEATAPVPSTLPLTLATLAEQAAGDRRVAARDQIRRLPHRRPPAGRRRTAAFAQRAGLDGALLRRRRGARRPAGIRDVAGR